MLIYNMIAIQNTSYVYIKQPLMSVPVNRTGSQIVYQKLLTMLNGVFNDIKMNERNKIINVILFLSYAQQYTNENGCNITQLKQDGTIVFKKINTIQEYENEFEKVIAYIR